MGLCFGSYAQALSKVVVGCDQDDKSISGNKPLTALLLDLITENVVVKRKTGELFIITDKEASNLINSKADVLRTIVDASAKPRVIEAARDYFEDVVVPYINRDLLESLVAELTELVLQDEKLPETTRAEFLDLANRSLHPEFLSRVFLYSLRKPNKIALQESTAYKNEASTTLKTDNNSHTTLTLLVGLPGSGKTHYRNAYMDATVAEVCTDNIRKEFFNAKSKQEYQEKHFDGASQFEGTNENLIFALAKNRIRSNLQNGISVVFEAINIEECLVSDFIKIAEDCNAAVKGLLFYCPIWELLRRNYMRGEANLEFDRYILDKYYEYVIDKDTGEMRVEWAAKYNIPLTKTSTFNSQPAL